MGAGGRASELAGPQPGGASAAWPAPTGRRAAERISRLPQVCTGAKSETESKLAARKVHSSRRPAAAATPAAAASTPPAEAPTRAARLPHARALPSRLTPPPSPCLPCLPLPSFSTRASSRSWATRSPSPSSRSKTWSGPAT
jgi:hypothetical protein